jgi:hypothetical protein
MDGKAPRTSQPEIIVGRSGMSSLFVFEVAGRYNPCGVRCSKNRTSSKDSPRKREADVSPSENET